MISILASAQASTGVGDEGVKQIRVENVEGIARAAASGTSVVRIQGRMNPGDEWLDIVTLTNDEAKIIALMPEMQCVVDAVSGTVTVYVDD